MISSFFRNLISAFVLILFTWTTFAQVMPREVQKLAPLGELGQRVGRLIIENRDPVLSTVLLSGLRHPRIKVLSLRDLQFDWSDEFLAIAVVENRPFSRVHIMQVGQTPNYNDELTQNFLAREKLSEGYFWLVLPKTNNKRNVMTAAHELTHVFVQKFFDDNATILLNRYPGLFIGTRGQRLIIDSDVYSYLTELFARVIEYAYFNIVVSELRDPNNEFPDAPYLKKGDTFPQFRWKATQYLIREYKIPEEKARAWMNSNIIKDMITYARRTGSI